MTKITNDLLSLLDGHDPLAEAAAEAETKAKAAKEAKEKKATQGRPSKIEFTLPGHARFSGQLTIYLKHKESTYSAVLRRDGTVLVPGLGEFDTPSAAAVKIRGSRVNGWKAWTYLDGDDTFSIGKLRGDDVAPKGKRGRKAKTDYELRQVVASATATIRADLDGCGAPADWGLIASHARKAKAAAAELAERTKAHADAVDVEAGKRILADTPTPIADAVVELAQEVEAIQAPPPVACLGGNACEGDTTKAAPVVVPTFPVPVTVLPAIVPMSKDEAIPGHPDILNALGSEATSDDW